MSDSPLVAMPRPDRDAQIRAILGPDIFGWAVGLLPNGVAIEDVRYRDLIDVSEADVFAYAQERGFDDRVVAVDAIRDDRMCIVQGPGGWTIFYTERGRRSDEATFTRRDDAWREVVRRQMRLARIMLNHRFWHAHELPFPVSENE